MTSAKPSALEQQRRDFIQANRTLYEYIVALESAKVWDSAGDQASGTDDGMGLANRMWSRSSASSAKAHELAQSTVEGVGRKERERDLAAQTAPIAAPVETENQQ